MADRKFAAKIMGRPDEGDALFECVKKDNQLTGRAFMVRFRYKDRKPDFVMWAHAADGGFRDEGPTHECLVVIFSKLVAFIRGHYLEIVLSLIETERTIIIEEADEAAAAMLMAHNETVSENARMPVVTSITVEPDLETRINQVLKKEEPDETGY